MEDKYIWKIQSYKPNPIVGLVFCIFSGVLLFILMTNQPLNNILPPVIVLAVVFSTGLYNILKHLFLMYPIQINICANSLEVVYSKGSVKQFMYKEIKQIAFNIRPPQCRWYRLSSPNFEFYGSKNKLIVEGDVPTYEQFQKVYNLLKHFPVRIFIPDYTEASYEKFFNKASNK